MTRIFSLFLDRLAERFAALLAGSLTSRIEGLHAVAQAEQQSQLEDLARHYEADGKTEIAVTLRQRATRLTSADLAVEAVEIVGRLTAESPRLTTSTTTTSQGNLDRVPDFTATSAVGRGKRRKLIDNDAISGDEGATS